MTASAWSPRARLSIAALLGFVGILWLATLVYPGGSWLRPHGGSGFSWLENYWCDLLRRPAHNGEVNDRAVTFATLSFVMIGLSLAPFWLEVSRLLSAGQARFVRVAGLISSVATACVALVPSDRFPLLHAPVVLSAGGLGFACGCLVSLQALKQSRRMPKFAGFSVLLVTAAAANLVQYVWVAYFDGPNTVVLPTVQKLATLALVGWIACGLSECRPRP